LTLHYDAAAAETSAARIHGLETLQRLPRRLVVVTGDATVRGECRDGYVVRRAYLPRHHRTSQHGVPLTSAARTVIDLARRWPPREALVLADSALRLGVASIDQLRATLDDCHRWPGAEQARRVVALAAPKAESVLESLSRVAMRTEGLPPPRTQVVIGGARVDFLWEDFAVIGEADGLGKYEPSGRRTTRDIIRAEKRREERLAEPGLGIGASIWGAITLLLACFLGGMVSTRVTDRPDRGGAFIHGTLVWTLVAVFLLWLVGQGISFGLSNLLGALGGLTQTATTAVTSVVSGDGDLAQRLGLDNPSQIMNRLNDPEVVSVFASATGMPENEAQTALNQLRSQVEAVRDNPDQVASEVRNFLTQYADRAKQQARQVGATVQEGATVGAWITFGVLAVTLIVAVLGARAGIPTASPAPGRS
jgi:hypothetical protein